MAVNAAERSRETNAEIDGVVLTAIEAGITAACGERFESMTESILTANGVPEPMAGEWYEVDTCQAVYADLESTVGPNTVCRIGRELPRLLAWPDTVRNVGDALETLHSVYRRQTRGPAGTFEFDRAGRHTGVLRSTTPFPRSFEQGLICGIGTRFGADTGFIAIAQDNHTESEAERAHQLKWWGHPDDRRDVLLAD